MMLNTKHTFILLSTILINTLFYQNIFSQQVHIGQKCPNDKLTTLLNYKSKEANLLTAFNAKPLLIDFWFTHCPPCLDLIPRLDSLQKAYNNQFNVLLVTYEKEEDVKSFFKKNESLRNIHLPIVFAANDKSNLRKMFPHFGEPHEVWINKQGIVQAITSHLELTQDNLDRFIRGDSLHLPEKRDRMDEKIALGDQALLITDEETSNGLRKLYYSWIGVADPQVPSLYAFKLEKDKKGRKIICQNLDIYSLYQAAYSDFQGNRSIKIIPYFKDTLKLQSDERTSKNIFCYEIFMRDTSRTRIKERMQKELDEFFHLSSSIQRKNVPCYVLTKIKDTVAFATKQKTSPFNEQKKDSIFIKSIELQFVARNRLYMNLEHDVINETGYTGRVDLVIPNSTDIRILKKGLNKYGLDINLEERVENSVILKDAP